MLTCDSVVNFSVAEDYEGSITPGFDGQSDPISETDNLH